MSKNKPKLDQAKKQKDFWRGFGFYLRQKRIEAGLTEQQVSEYLGASSQTVLSYETGEKPIPLNRVYALANCLNISPELVTKKLSSWDMLHLA